MTHTKPHLISAALSIILLGYSNLSLASIELANIDTGSKKNKSRTWWLRKSRCSSCIW